MRARRFVQLATAALLLVPATAASAHIEDFGNLTKVVDAGGDIEPDAVQGTIRCTEGERFLVTAKVVEEPSYVGKGRVKGVCTGSNQDWTAPLTDESGTATGGAFCISAKAHTKIDGVPHDEARRSVCAAIF